MNILKKSLIICFCSILLFSCNNSKYSYSEDGKSIEISLQDMLPSTMVDAILSDSSEAEIPIQLKDKEGNNLKNANFIIDYGNNSVNLLSNAEGIVLITLNATLINANPLIKISHDNVPAQEIKYSVGGKAMTFVNGKSVNTQVLSYDNVPFIEQNNFRVYYLSHPDTAKAYFDEFYKSFQLIEVALGKEKVHVIYPLLASKEHITVVGEPQKITLFPIDQSLSKQVYWFFIHENVEDELICVKSVYEKNPNTRYIGDGLAEYISLKLLKSINPSYADDMLNNRIWGLEKTSIKEVDLRTWTPDDGQTVNYSYSFAFWLKLEKEYGTERVLDFVHSFLALEKFDETTISNLFSEIFSKNIQYSLTKKEAIEILSLHQK